MRNIIVNYWKSRSRSTPINIAVVRIFLGCYVIWKILSIDWKSLAEWPTYSYIPWTSQYGQLVSPTTFELLYMISWIVIGIACLFIIGYRLRFTSLLLAFGISYLAVHRYMINISGGTQSLFIATHFIVLFGLFSETDILSIDGIRNIEGKSVDDLNQHLQSSSRRLYSMVILKWLLVIIAIIYFGSGFRKVVDGPLLAWIQPDTISRFITHREVMHFATRPIGDLIASSTLLSGFSAISTIILEVGFLIAIIIGFPLLPFVAGLIGIHLVIAISIGPFFFDQILFLLFFIRWDGLYRTTISNREIDLVYDERCSFCMKAIYIIDILDMKNTISFYPKHSDKMGPHNCAKTDLIICTFVDGSTYEGYYALRSVIEQFRLFLPIVLLMKIPIAESIGKYLYRSIVDSRNGCSKW